MKIEGSSAHKKAAGIISLLIITMNAQLECNSHVTVTHDTDIALNTKTLDEYRNRSRNVYIRCATAAATTAVRR